MKRILLLLFSIYSFVLSGQTITGNKAIIRTQLELAGYKVTGISNDSGMTANSIMTLPTQYAVRNYVQNYVNSHAASAAGSSGQIQYNNAGSFGALDSLTVASNPDRVGIGVPSPTARLDIQGSGSTSATNALRVSNSAGMETFKVDNSGVTRINSTLQFIRPSGAYDGANFSHDNAYFNFNDGTYGFRITSNTTGSKPALHFTGTGYSGGTATTTKPTLLIEPIGTTSTGWSTSGTKLGVNAESGFTGNLLDLQVNGQQRFVINPSLGFHGVVVGSNQFTFVHSLSPTSGAGFRITTNGSGKTYLDGWSDGAPKALNYDIIIGSRGNNLTSSITGSTTAENGSNVQIGFDATSNPRALLSLNSTTRGFLPTRMTTTQRDAVTWVTGDAGMMIFNSTLIKLQVWNGSAWETVTSL